MDADLLAASFGAISIEDLKKERVPEDTAAPELKSQIVAVDPKDQLHETAIYLQAACLKHKYTRSRKVSAIYERPERMRAVALGLSAALARLSEPQAHDGSQDPPTTNETRQRPQVSVVHSTSSCSLVNHPAIRYIHAKDLEDSSYLQNLASWCANSKAKHAIGESEIPAHMDQNDMYLCEASSSHRRRSWSEAAALSNSTSLTDKEQAQHWRP